MLDLKKNIDGNGEFIVPSSFNENNELAIRVKESFYWDPLIIMVLKVFNLVF